MYRHITLLAALALSVAAVPACRPADAATYGKQISPFTVDGVGVVATTALLDLTVTASSIPLSVPQRPGYYFNPMTAKLIVSDVTGTATSGTLGMHYGNDAGQSNGSATNLAVAAVNALAGLYPAGITIGAGASTMRDSASFPFFANIATVLTGVTAAHGRVVVLGAWVPIN